MEVDDFFLQINDKFSDVPSPNERGNTAINLLEDKYGIPFFYTEVRAIGSIMDEYYTVICYPTEEPEIVFEARVSLDGKTIEDEFAVKLACVRYCREMLKRTTRINGCLYIQMNSLVRGFCFENKKISIKEIQSINAKNCYIINLFYTRDEQGRDDLYDIVNQMLSGEERINGLINMYILPDKLRKKAQIYIESHDKCYADFDELLEGHLPFRAEIINNKLDISRAEWEKGCEY